MTAPFLAAFGLVFLAELGDKSQLIALTFATRYRWWVVLGGIFVAIAMMQALAVGAGQVLGFLLPGWLLSLLAGAAFIGFGIWTLRPESPGEAEEHVDEAQGLRRFGPMVLIGGTFLLAEIGDKTMLAAGVLSAENPGSFLPLWLGATLGMFLADAIAVAVGVFLGRHLPHQLIKIAAGILFLLFGGWILVSTLLSGDVPPG